MRRRETLMVYVLAFSLPGLSTRAQEDCGSGPASDVPALAQSVDEGLGSVSEANRRWMSPFPPHREKFSTFILGGTNEDATVFITPTLAGKRIDDLENAMRPAAVSKLGYLGPQERLKNVLIADNQLVRALGVTHQDLARHLRAIMIRAWSARHEALDRYDAELEAFSRGDRGPLPEDPEHQTWNLRYRDVPYRVRIIEWDSGHETPFGDGILPSYDMIIENRTNGVKVVASTAHPQIIERYGFYEGHGTAFRIDPRDLVDLFSFLKTPSEVPWPMTAEELESLGYVLQAPPEEYEDYLRINVANRLKRVPAPQALQLAPLVQGTSRTQKVLSRALGETTRSKTTEP